MEENERIQECGNGRQCGNAGMRECGNKEKKEKNKEMKINFKI